MPTYRKGNIFDSDADIRIITTNGCINAKGELVMGRGAALEAKNRYRNIAYFAAQEIKKYPYLQSRGVYVYRFIMLNAPYDYIGLFQVKYHWSEKADPALIIQSATRLRAMAKVTGLTYALNFPGTGNGKLSRNDVLPILETLPSNVHIYEL